MTYCRKRIEIGKKILSSKIYTLNISYLLNKSYMLYLNIFIYLL